MKNILFIDVDTEKESPLTIGKPEDFPKPSNEEEAKVMIMNDITCICEALLTLINVAGHNGYADKDKLIDVAISRLNELKG